MSVGGVKQMSLRPRPTAVGVVGAVTPRTPSTAASGTRLEQVLRAGRTEDVGVYARPPSTSTPELAAKLAMALGKGDNQWEIKQLLKANGGKMILLASAGASKKKDLFQLQKYDPIAQWSTGFLYMAFTPVLSNVVNAVKELNMMNIAHVWLMPDGSIEPVTKESMKSWSLKWSGGEARGPSLKRRGRGA